MVIASHRDCTEKIFTKIVCYVHIMFPTCTRKLLCKHHDALSDNVAGIPPAGLKAPLPQLSMQFQQSEPMTSYCTCRSPRPCRTIAVPSIVRQRHEVAPSKRVVSAQPGVDSLCRGLRFSGPGFENAPPSGDRHVRRRLLSLSLRIGARHPASQGYGQGRNPPRA